MITLYYAPESRANVALSLLRRMGHETSVDIATVHIDRQDGQGRKDPNNPHPALISLTLSDVPSSLITSTSASWAM